MMIKINIKQTKSHAYYNRNLNVKSKENGNKNFSASGSRTHDRVASLQGLSHWASQDTGRLLQSPYIC